MTRTKGWLDDSHLSELMARATPPEQLAISLMADCGCRLREALAFDPTSLAPTLLRIYSTKVRRWRSVPRCARLNAAIAAALRWQRHTRSPRLFPFSPRQLQRRLLELCAAAHTPPTTPHRLRHSYATRLNAERVPLHTISALLGHANLATTLLYLHLGETDYDQARKALDRRAARLRQRPRPHTLDR